MCVPGELCKVCPLAAGPQSLSTKPRPGSTPWNYRHSGKWGHLRKGDLPSKRQTAGLTSKKWRRRPFFSRPSPRARGWFRDQNQILCWADRGDREGGGPVWPTAAKAAGRVAIFTAHWDGRRRPKPSPVLPAMVQKVLRETSSGRVPRVSGEFPR